MSVTFRDVDSDDAVLVIIQSSSLRFSRDAHGNGRMQEYVGKEAGSVNETMIEKLKFAEAWKGYGRSAGLRPARCFLPENGVESGI